MSASAGEGVTIDCAGASIRLLPDGAVLWEATATLWLSDLHLGKAAHFRKHGVPIGSEPTLATLHRLRQQLMRWTPRRVLLLGDLFHSDINILNDWMMDIALRLLNGKVDGLTNNLYLRRCYRWRRQ